MSLYSQSNTLPTKSLLCWCCSFFKALWNIHIIRACPSIIWIGIYFFIDKYYKSISHLVVPASYMGLYPILSIITDTSLNRAYMPILPKERINIPKTVIYPPLFKTGYISFFQIYRLNGRSHTEQIVTVFVWFVHPKKTLTVWEVKMELF